MWEARLKWQRPGRPATSGLVASCGGHDQDVVAGFGLNLRELTPSKPEEEATGRDREPADVNGSDFLLAVAQPDFPGVPAANDQKPPSPAWRSGSEVADR